MPRKYKQIQRRRNWNLNKESLSNRKRNKRNSLIRQEKKKWRRFDNKRKLLSRDKRISPWLITPAKETVKRLKASESSLPRQEKKRCKRRSTRRRRSIGLRDRLVIWGKRTRNYATKSQIMMNSFEIKESVSLLDNKFNRFNRFNNRSSRSHNNLRFHNNNNCNNKFKLHPNKQV